MIKVCEITDFLNEVSMQMSFGTFRIFNHVLQKSGLAVKKPTVKSSLFFRLLIDIPAHCSFYFWCSDDRDDLIKLCKKYLHFVCKLKRSPFCMFLWTSLLYLLRVIYMRWSMIATWLQVAENLQSLCKSGKKFAKFSAMDCTLSCQLLSLNLSNIFVKL